MAKAVRQPDFFCLNGRRLLFLTFLFPITPSHKHILSYYLKQGRWTLFSEKENDQFGENALLLLGSEANWWYFLVCMFITEFSLIIFQRWPWSNTFSTQIGARAFPKISLIWNKWGNIKHSFFKVPANLIAVRIKSFSLHITNFIYVGWLIRPSEKPNGYSISDAAFSNNINPS